MKLVTMDLLMSAVLIAAGWTVMSAQSTPTEPPAAQRIGLTLVDNKSTYVVDDEKNSYENILRLDQPDGNYKLTAGMLNDGDNHIVVHRSDDKGNDTVVARFNLHGVYYAPTTKVVSTVGFNATSSTTTITQAMLPDNWGTDGSNLILQTNGYLYITGQGGLTFTVPEGYSNSIMQLIIYVGSNVRGGYFAYNHNNTGWYVGSQVSANTGYTYTTLTGVNSGDVISICGAESSSGSYYLADSPDIELLGITEQPVTQMPSMTVTPTISYRDGDAWGNEASAGSTMTYSINDEVALGSLGTVTDRFDETTATNEHPSSYSYNVAFDSDIILPANGATGLDFGASADFASATGSSPTTAAFTGPENWKFIATNVYSPSAGKSCYILRHGSILYVLPPTFMGNSVNVTVTSANSDDGAGDLYVNDVVHTFTAGETYTWTVPASANGAIELRSNPVGSFSNTYSNDFTSITISSGASMLHSAGPRQIGIHDSMEDIYHAIGKPLPMNETKEEINNMAKINH